MDMDADQIVDALKGHFNVDSDIELARALKIDKRTVSAWRSRKRVPQRFIGMLTGQSSHPHAVGPVYWHNQEKAAFCLALFRYARAYTSEFNEKGFNEALKVLDHANDDFWALMRRAQSDIGKLEGGNSTSAALSMLIHDDIENSAAINEQSHRIMRENRPSITWSDGTTTDAKGRPLSSS
ncbi:hypothetical protein [Meridianimarinicoccus aquatilis]|uniref:Bacteriophage CI repressor n=1 Tax=Meridianimarinicoccus aquatilis TaxID=2552766 RepID=A0A4V6PPF0_9RHOB|nr:hypothetical protein [Fluviibacterium aquatile]TDL88039.1 hypothetical protein E2L05_09855 [Fluviibacterium aquatile]